MTTRRRRAGRFTAASLQAAAVVTASLLSCEQRAAKPEASVLDAPLERPARGDTARALARLVEAKGLVAAGRALEAEPILDDALDADPACVDARVEYGFLLLQELDDTNAGEALRQFRIARLLVPDHPLAVCGEGIARQELGDEERAEPLLRTALATPEVRAATGRHVVATGALAKIDANRGRIDEALRGFADAAGVPGLPPKTAASYLARRANVLAQAGRPAEAEAELGKALALDPENVRARFLLSQLLAKRGATAEAEREARIHELLRELEDHTARRFVLDAERTQRLRRELDELLRR